MLCLLHLLAAAFVLSATAARRVVAVEPPFVDRTSCQQGHVLRSVRNDDTPFALTLDFHCVSLYTSRLRRILKQQSVVRSERPRRGIVYSGGGRNQVANIIIAVTYVRNKLRSKLPIEVIHYGEDEMPPAYARMLSDAALGPLKIVDGAKVPYPAHHRPTNISWYASKVWALYAATSFDEVLLLDADSYPLQQPEAYFEAEPYRKHGNMFFPDFWRNEYSKEEVYQALGMEPPWKSDPGHRQAETGQVVFNRRRHAVVLEWLWYLNAHHPYVYSKLLGDKDTFRMAFYLADQLDSYAQSPVWNSMLLKHVPNGMTCSSGAKFALVAHVQYGWDGTPWFVHQQKWYPMAKEKAQQDIGWDRPDWVSAPTSDAQARQLLKDGCNALNATEADAHSFLRCTVAPASLSSVLNITSACGWDAAWKARDNNASEPLPVFPVAWLPGVHEGVTSVADTYRSLRRQLDAAFSFLQLDRSAAKANADVGSVWLDQRRRRVLRGTAVGGRGGGLNRRMIHAPDRLPSVR